jgi:hypothetical protein
VDDVDETAADGWLLIKLIMLTCLQQKKWNLTIMKSSRRV